jgi:hypothetical protein
MINLRGAVAVPATQSLTGTMPTELDRAGEDLDLPRVAAVSVGPDCERITVHAPHHAGERETEFHERSPLGAFAEFAPFAGPN